MRKAVIQKLLDQQRNACYVLITCGEPSEEGKMEVELTYEGDQDLATYLIESAHQYICTSSEGEFGEELGI
ncbi:MAG: hypothetical protein JSR80_00930 [Verrucomicrobia bacterium]|nr:hypothetical protein [Verrucomicrobiota bacterium]